MIVINILFKQVLIKEPPTQNPFKLVYKVLAYAVKNKFPRQRSAFTYCEDGIPSRIDLGKNKYGGPFTTEQVEDVKTLFRVITVFVIGSAMFALTEEWSSLKQDVNSLIRNEGTDRQFSKCSSDYIITGMLLHQRNNLNTIIMSFFSIQSSIVAHQTPKVKTNSLLQDPS